MTARPLREAHAHIAQHGRAMTMERFQDCTGLGACLQQIAAAADRLRSAPATEWLLGDGLRIEGWPEHRFPIASEIDSASGDRPVCIWSFDYHGLIINTAAMRALGITRASPDPVHGRITRDAKGVPTGLMIEAAAKMVWNVIPEPTPAQRKEHVRMALADLAHHGFTEIHDLLSQPWLGPVLAELDDAGELKAKVLVYPRIEDLAAVHAAAAPWQRDRVHLAGGKLFADGTLNSRTAWMLEPYADPLPGLPRGEQMASHQQIRDAMRLTQRLRVGLAVHAIGDAAVRAVLDVYRSMRPTQDRAGIRTEPDTISGFPALRIEHAEVIDEADVPRFAELGVVCSVQPCHLLADIEALTRGLPHRLHRVLPLRDLVQAGCRPGELLWFGSDTPIVRPHPEDSIVAATQRRRADMPASQAIAIEQALSIEESWRAFY